MMTEEQVAKALATKTTLEFDKYVCENDLTIEKWPTEVHEHIKKMRKEAVKEFDIRIPIYTIKAPKE